MDKWFEFPEFINFPLAEWIDTTMDWVTTNWAAGFDASDFPKHKTCGRPVAG